MKNVVKDVFRLNGTKSLDHKIVSITYETEYVEKVFRYRRYFQTISKVVDETENLIESFPLTEIPGTEISSLWKSKKPCLILKKDMKYFYTEVPKDLCIDFDTHLCAPSGSVCHHLSAASDSGGGCAKVRAKSKHIERFPWITCGCETFNTLHDIFLVSSCNHYEEEQDEPKKIEYF